MTTALIGITALGAVLFCFFYALLAPFYRSEAGWNFMAFMAVVAVMVTLSMYYKGTGQHAPIWLANLMWFLAAACVWWRVTIVLRAQLRRRKASR